MGPFTDFAASLRALRRAKSFRSASALARRAGLSPSHIAMFERGEVRPRWRTAIKLADALGLAGAERDAFFRVLDAAGKPQSVQTATRSGPWFGSAAIWQTLPRELFKLNPEEEPLRAAAADELYATVVPAVAAMLSWAELRSTRDDCSRFGDLAAEVFLHMVSRNSEYPPRMRKRLRLAMIPGAAASAFQSLASQWRAAVFSNDATCLRLVSHIESWSRAGTQIGVVLKRPLESLSLEGYVDPVLVRWTFETLISWRLWQATGLSERLNVAWPALPDHFSAALDRLFALPATARSDPKWESLWHACDTVRVGLKLFEEEALGSMLMARDRGSKGESHAAITKRLAVADRVVLKGMGN